MPTSSCKLSTITASSSYPSSLQLGSMTPAMTLPMNASTTASNHMYVLYHSYVVPSFPDYPRKLAGLYDISARRLPATYQRGTVSAARIKQARPQLRYQTINDRTARCGHGGQGRIDATVVPIRAGSRTMIHASSCWRGYTITVCANIITRMSAELHLLAVSRRAVTPPLGPSIRPAAGAVRELLRLYLMGLEPCTRI